MTTPGSHARVKPTVAVDLDGVLAQYDGWKGVVHIGEPLPGAREFLVELRKRYRVLIHTTRLNVTLNRDEAGVTGPICLIRLVANWLQKHKMPYDDLHIEEGKPLAVAYIDDRAVRCSPQTYAAPHLAYSEALAWMLYLERSGLMGRWGPEQEAAAQRDDSSPAGDEPMGET